MHGIHVTDVIACSQLKLLYTDKTHKHKAASQLHVQSIKMVR